MEDLNLFTKSQLQKIALLRVLCSNATIYMLNMPFAYLDDEYASLLDKILRKRQFEKNVTVVMGEIYLDYVEAMDKIIVLTKGEQTLYDYYEQLIQDP